MTTLIQLIMLFNNDKNAMRYIRELLGDYLDNIIDFERVVQDLDTFLGVELTEFQAERLQKVMDNGSWKSAFALYDKDYNTYLGV